MKLKILLLSIAALFTQPTFAISLSDAPNACPGIAAIKTVGIQFASRDSTWGWMGFAHNQQYDTNVKWTFVTFIQANVKNEQEAIKKANADLSLLTTVQGPEHKNDNDGTDIWICLYTGNNHELALAVTPPFPQKIMSIVSRYGH